MQESEDEITTLLKKIEQQDEIIVKLKNEQAKLSNYIKEFKAAIEKKTAKEM